MATSSGIAIKKLVNNYFILFPDEAAKLLSTFNEEEILEYLKEQPVNIGVRVFRSINPDISAGVVKIMSEDYFVQLFSMLDPNLSARLLTRLDKDLAKRRLSLLSPNLSKELRELMLYPADTAGYLIDAKVTTFYPDETIKAVLKRLRSVRDRRIVNIYVIDTEGCLTGVIPLQDIVISDTDELLKNLINTPPVCIDAMSPREEVVQLLEERKLINLPVVDFDKRLLGVIRYDTLVNAAQLDATEDAQAMFGAGRDERALSKVSFAVKKRLPWLEINLATAFLAAAVIGIFEDTIARITVLAVFLPVVAGQSGNTGSQALAVTIRGLALREIRPSHWFKIAKKEIAVGFINGLAVALTTAVIVYFWTGAIGLPIVIGISMIFSMVIAGMSGAVIPVMLKAIGQDPAQSSSIVLTTVTDVFGFLSFLGLATALASVLGIS